MILEKFPNLRQLDRNSQMQLAAELWDEALGGVADISPEVLAAVEERVAYNDAHPGQAFTTEQVSARLAELKRKIAARRAHA